MGFQMQICSILRFSWSVKFLGKSRAREKRNHVISIVCSVIPPISAPEITQLLYILEQVFHIWKSINNGEVVKKNEAILNQPTLFPFRYFVTHFQCTLLILHLKCLLTELM